MIKFKNKDYRKGGLFLRMGGSISKDMLKKYFPDRDRKARKAKYKAQAKALLDSMEYEE